MPKTRTKKSVTKTGRCSLANMLAIIVVEYFERRGIRVNASPTAPGAA